ncbi:unnamed protein product [Peronospora belbahrii]|uniref:Serine/threonine-protein phosphatase PGAM5, mitochondrial n=1 Tax=Peronospora belbahrii TaxID=622444 RepID=A0AAU9KQ97_9STRA|nr:unnamed protein product [Peronospora belbahrii]
MVNLIVETLFRVLTSVASVSVTLSMGPSIYRIYCNRDTGVASVLPLVCMVTNAHVWMLNGVTVKNWFPVFTTFITSDVIAICYVTVFYCYARDRKKALCRIIIGSIILCLVTTYAILGNAGRTNQSQDGVETTLGILGVLAGLSMFCSPFERMMKILHYKSAVFIPIPMVVTGTLNNLMWLVYCPMVGSWFLFGSNVMCLLVCSVNLILYIIYNPETHPLPLEEGDGDENAPSRVESVSINKFTSRPNQFGATKVHDTTQGSRPSMMASIMRPSSMMRQSMVTDLSNNFSQTKIHDANVQVFANDVLMEGALMKKGEAGLRGWKNRIFVLRGKELSYYTIDNKQQYGALKGMWDVVGASVERQDNVSFSLKLANGSIRILEAPDVQTLMDWMTAIAVAAEAHFVQPATDLSLVDQSRTTHIILVRHGHYARSQTPSIDINGPLTELGIRQARATGRFLHTYLSERMVLKRFPKFLVYHSGTRRAVETAEYIGNAFPEKSLQLRENKLFREAWPGNPLPNGNRQQLAREKLDNMVSDCARLKMAYRTMFRHLIPQDLEVEEHKLSEEDHTHYASKFGARSTQTRANDRFRVMVCHANIIRWFVCKALGVNPDGTWGRMRYNHCGITAMEVDSVGNVQLTYMNQTGHLETTQLTEA